MQDKEAEMIIEEIRHMAGRAAEGRRVVDVRIGLGYTAAMLDDGGVGVAYTFRGAGGGCSVFTGGRPIAGRPALEILEYLGSSDPIECTVGLAVANAVINRPSPQQAEGDILDLLTVRAEDRVGMVGFFGPLVTPLERRAKELLIFERDPGRSARTLPAEEALEMLPGCDVAVITSTALILGGLDDLLEAARNCREVALVGASTPLAADVFAPLGVTLLSGITVTNGAGILQVVSEGGGMGFFGDKVRKVNLPVTR
jgi:uncharacterized protein